MAYGGLANAPKIIYPTGGGTTLYLPRNFTSWKRSKTINSQVSKGMTYTQVVTYPELFEISATTGVFECKATSGWFYEQWITGAGNITDADAAASVVTCTTDTVHSLLVGDSITVAGLATGTLNGTKTIVSTPTSTTFTYACAAESTTNETGTWAYALTSNFYTAWERFFDAIIKNGSVFDLYKEADGTTVNGDDNRYQYCVWTGDDDGLEQKEGADAWTLKLKIRTEGAAR